MQRFLQARLHLDFLTTKTTLRKMKDALKSLPEGLNNTYDETMKRIDSQHPDHAILAKKVLYWIFYAFRPLTVSELQHALAVETGDSNLDDDNIPEEELILSVCNGLVTREKEGGFLALVHYSFQQYLEQKAESLFPEAMVDIVQTCLTYFSFDEFEQGPCHEPQDFTFRLKKWPLLSYAVPNWGQHACQGAEEACRDLILSFLSQSAKVSASVQVLWARESMGVNYPNNFPSDVSALWIASLYGLESTVCHLLPSQRAIIDKKTTWGDTALHRASCGKSVGILQMLLEHGADVFAEDCAGNTPLHVAVLLWPHTFFAFYELTSQSLEDVDRIMREENSRLPDMSLNVAQSLLDHGADVNAINLNGETALHLSVRRGKPSLTRLFLARGADITLKDRLRHPPLTLASKFGRRETVRLLLQHDLQRLVESGILDSATRIAAFWDQVFVLEVMLEVMLAKSSEQPPPGPAGRSLLHISACGGSLKCLQYLENRGFDLGALDEQRRTCLHHAAAGPRASAVVEYLLEQGVNPNQSDVDGWTPLLWAAKSGNVSSVQMLLDAGAESFHQSDRVWIPYAIATYHENTRAAAILRPSNRSLPEVFHTQNTGISLRHPGIICDGCDLVSGRSLPSNFPRLRPLTLSSRSSTPDTSVQCARTTTIASSAHYLPRSRTLLTISTSSTGTTGTKTCED